MHQLSGPSHECRTASTSRFSSRLRAPDCRNRLSTTVGDCRQSPSAQPADFGTAPHYRNRRGVDANVEALIREADSATPGNPRVGASERKPQRGALSVSELPACGAAITMPANASVQGRRQTRIALRL